MHCFRRTSLFSSHTNSNLEEGAAGLFRMKTHMQQRETKSCDLVVAAVDRAIAALQAHKAAVVRVCYTHMYTCK